MNEILPISTLTVDKALNGDTILNDQENIKLLMQFQSMLLKDLLFFKSYTYDTNTTRSLLLICLICLFLQHYTA